MNKFTLKIKKGLHDRAFYRRSRARHDSKRSDVRALNLEGKTAVVFGVATDQSIAWRVAKTLNDHGCRIALGYQKRVEDYVVELSKELNDPVRQICELTEDEQIDSYFSLIKQKLGNIDLLIHSVAFTKREFLDGLYLNIDRKGFQVAHDVSAYSLTAIAKRALPLMNDGGRILTMTYLGSQRAIPNYNIMGVAKAALESSVRYLARDVGERGITVNAISAGPIKTLAASGISGFDSARANVKRLSPLHRNITTEDVAGAALFLCSDLARNITGQVIYVDAGYSIVGIS